MKQIQNAILAVSMSVFAFSQLAFAQETIVAEAAPKSHAYPTALLERNFTMPAGTGEMGASMKFGHHFDANSKVVPDMASLSRINASFGVTDDFQLGLAWSGFQIPRMDLDRSLELSADYFVFANKYAAGMATVSLPFHFDSSVVRNVKFGMLTAFGIAKDWSFSTFYDLVDFRFQDRNFEATFKVPAKLTWQTTSRLALGISTQLAQFETNSAKAHHFFWQSAPLNLHGLYAITNTFDIVATVGADRIERPHQGVGFTLGVNYRVGDLG